MGTTMITEVTDEKISIALFLSNWDINLIWSRYIMYNKNKSNYISGQRNYINRLQINLVYNIWEMIKNLDPDWIMK